MDAIESIVMVGLVVKMMRSLLLYNQMTHIFNLHHMSHMPPHGVLLHVLGYSMRRTNVRHMISPTMGGCIVSSRDLDVVQEACQRLSSLDWVSKLKEPSNLQDNPVLTGLKETCPSGSSLSERLAVVLKAHDVGLDLTRHSDQLAVQWRGDDADVKALMDYLN